MVVSNAAVASVTPCTQVCWPQVLLSSQYALYSAFVSILIWIHASRSFAVGQAELS